MNINKRLAALRQQMKAHQVDAYIVPSSDPHQSEYVADHWKTRIWLSGFTGSAGILIVTQDHAGVWTDSRYFIQAERELAESEVELHKQGIPHAPEHVEWLAQNLPEGATVGCDGFLFSVGQIRHLHKHFHVKNIEINYELDLVAPIWEDREPLPKNLIFEHDFKYAGVSREAKLEEIRDEMDIQGADFYLISTLDDVAWTLNIRSNDIDCNPLTIAYLLVGMKAAYLFIDQDKVHEGIKANLLQDGVVLRPYNDLLRFMNDIPSEESVLVDVGTTSIRVFNALKITQIIKGNNIVMPLKAIKNETEIAHIQDAMVKDGVALTHLFRWLDAELETRTVSEVEVAEQLDTFRRAQGGYFGESFNAIVGYQSNGAIVHYRPEAKTCAHLKKEGILLLDSGGQYINGTTDITRTVALGTPTAEQKRNFTLVLKGHIALATIRFPKGTKGMQLDTLARMYLWNDHLNYGHGTGHGVGFFLNVHEPPQGFATGGTTSRGITPLEPGMFTSNEPGFYKNGEYGIRIENLILCVEDIENEYATFYKHKTLTLFPIDLNLIEVSLLTEKERTWLNDYHAQVQRELSPLLNAEEKAWMEAQCRAI